MGHLQDINKVEARAVKLNLSARQLCLRAGVDYKIWWRWRNGLSSPTLIKWTDAMERMSAALDAEEARLRSELLEGAA